MSKVESAQIINPFGIADEAAHIILEEEWKYFILAPLEEFGKHVLSFWLKGKSTGSMTVSYGKEYQEVSVTTDWQKVIFKFNVEAITNPWIYFSGTEYWLYNTQLELGDFATDYSRNPLDVEQDIADTKEQVEQYRRETYAEILVTQESITQSVIGLEERISANYYTKTETSSIITQTQSGILQTVSANITETKTYADTAATNAKNEAIKDVDDKLKSYTTTTELSSQIEQTQSSILQTVSATYATNGTVDEVKSSIASIEITANKIDWLVKSGTSSSNFTLTDRTASLIADYININGLVEFTGLDSNARSIINTASDDANSAKNRVDSWSASSNSTLIDAAKIYTGSILTSSSSTTKAVLSGGQLTFYKSDLATATFAATYWTGTSIYGTAVNSEPNSKFVSFGNKDSDSNTSYSTNLLLNYGLNPKDAYGTTLTHGVIVYSGSYFYDLAKFGSVYSGGAGSTSWVGGVHASAMTSTLCAIGADANPVTFNSIIRSLGFNWGAYPLVVYTNMLAVGTVNTMTGFNTVSDRRAKNEIEELNKEKSEKFIMSLRPVTFRYNLNQSGRKHHGFIADEVKKALDDLKDDWGVYTDPDVTSLSGYKGLRYEEFISDLICVVQEQNRRIKKLEAMLE